MKKRSLLLSAVFVLFWSLTAQAATYEVDADHTNVSFKVKHLFSWVQGEFREFQGMIDYEPGKPEAWSAQGTINVNSIDTRVEKRDEHLKSPDFFDVEKYPEISFHSTGVIESSDTQAKLKGLLTIHGVEKEVVIDVDLLGVDKDPWGNVIAGFQARLTINRKDFGLNWNKVLESGGLLVGEEVVITLDIAGIQKV